MKLRGIMGVVLDMDGTLVRSDLDFALIRSEADVPDDTPILEYLESAGRAERDKTLRVLHAHEERAADECTLQPGARRLLDGLRERGLRTALLTRNSCRSVRRVLERFELLFDCCIAREDAAPKPSPEPVHKIAGALDMPPEALLVVGDYIFDIESGRAAGARTALLCNERNEAFAREADLTIRQLDELLDYLPAVKTAGAHPEGA